MTNEKLCANAVLLLLCVWIDRFVGGYALSEIKVGVMHSGSSRAVYLSSYAGAITRAFDDINNNTEILNGIDFKYILADADCNSQMGIGAAVDLYNDGVKGFIGPPCSKSCLAAGLLSTNKKIPMISYSCSSIELSDKSVYPYFVRTKPYSRTSKEWTPKAFVSLMRYNGWQKVCLIERRHEIYTPIADSLREELIAEGYDILARELFISEDTTYEMKRPMMERLKDKCRIIFIISRVNDVTEFLVQAHHMGLLKNGDYAFVTIDYYVTKATKNPSDEWKIPGNNSTQRNEFLLKNILEGLLYLSVVYPVMGSTEKLVSFSNDVQRRYSLPPFNDTSVTPTISKNAAYLYDAILLMAKSFDTVLKEDPNNTLTNASHIYNVFLNTTVNEFTGLVRLDENGDRIPKFLLGNIHNSQFLNLVELDPGVSIPANITLFFPTGKTKAPRDVPICGFFRELCIEEKSSFNYIPVYIALLIVLVIIIFGAVYLYNKKKYEMQILCKELLVSGKEISFGGENTSFRSKISAISGQSLSRRGSGIVNVRHFHFGSTIKIVLYRSEKVYLKTIKSCKVDMNKQFLQQMKKMKDINHTNVNRFIGVMVTSPDVHALWSVCSKGSLQDVLQNDDIECDWSFRLSFVSDIAKGLNEIHKTGIHGHLTSSNCLIDNRWVCKLSNFGLTNFKSSIKGQPQDSYKIFRRQYWTAPEHLRTEELPLTKENDIYSYGIILYEISAREDPYYKQMEKDALEPKDVIELVKSIMIPPFRPAVLTENGAPELFNDLMKNCWEENPFERCTMKEILRIAFKLNRQYGMKGSLVDHMLTMMEKYTNNLEDIVADRTQQLEEEKIKTETLLYKMLPVSVANKLKEGQPVLAEQFDAVTIFFSDIVGFTSLCSESEPMEVVEMLNDLYVCFDNVIDSHDVYKVETIGDAYMVVSGLPLRNENRHAGEIATMSLDLLSSVLTFKVKHRPDHRLQLRIGIHTGPCVAGVVGLKMPRYCLFGDTVNYASRMESNGVALKIHVSPECKYALDDLGGYALVERGPVTMKGKGTIITYFLNGKDGYSKDLPDVQKVDV